MFVLRPGPSFWVGLSILLLLGLLGAVSSGLGSALWFMSLVAFVTGVLALIRRRRTLWFGTTTDGGVAALLIGSLVMGTAGLAMAGTSDPPKPQPTWPQYAPGTVTAGAYCAKSVAGWYGYTSKHVLMQCKTSATDTRLRWRAA